MECYCCFEMHDPATMAWCTACKTNGFICYTCLQLWGDERNDIAKCTICKQYGTMQNLPSPEHVVWIVDHSHVSDTWCKKAGRGCIWIGLATANILISGAFFAMLWLQRFSRAVAFASGYTFIFFIVYRRWIYDNLIPTILKPTNSFRETVS